VLKSRKTVIVAVALALTTFGFVGSGLASASAPTTLVIGSQVAPPGLDPTSNASAAIDEVFDYNVYQHLYQLNPKGQLVPTLATSYTLSPNGLTYTFKLRSGVQFSNGDAFTASNVVFSLNRAADPANGYPYQSLVSDVASVTAPNDTTAVVTLTHADSQFLYNLAAYSNGVILDPNAVSTIATQPVGTGPFTFVSMVPNYDIVLAGSPTFWGTPPAMRQIIWQYFANPTTMDSALQSGQIQVIDNLNSPSNVSAFKGNSAFQIIAGPTNGKIDLTVNNSKGPLKSLKVRQALYYALNRPAILKTVGAGYGTVISSDQVPGDPWYTPSVNSTYAYNPTKAKALLKAAGYPHGFTLTLSVPPYSYATEAAPLVQAMFAAVGVKVIIKPISWPLWISNVFLGSQNYQLTIIDQVEARDIPEYGDCSYYFNYAGCKAVNQMINAANQATSDAAMVTGYKAVVTKINADVANFWLYNPDQLTVAAKDVIGLPSGGLTESFNMQYLARSGKLSPSLIAQGFLN
jgi:peptide/nickel transport system substrate-binding protein